MLRLTSVACAVAIAFSSSAVAFEIPLFDKVPQTTTQAESPKTLSLSEPVSEKEGLLHLAERVTSAGGLIVAYGSYGFSVLQQTEGSLTLLKDYTYAELGFDNSSQNAVHLSADGSLLFISSYYQNKVFSLSSDGQIQALAQLSGNYSDSYKSNPSSSFVAFTYTNSGAQVSVQAFDKQTNTFAAPSLVSVQNQPNFAVYDESKKVLVLGVFQSLISSYVIASYKMDSQGAFSLVSEIPIANIPTEENVAYSQENGHIVLNTYLGTRLYSVASDGSLQFIQNNSTLLSQSPQRTRFSGSRLVAYYGNVVHSFSVSNSGFSDLKVMPLNGAKDLAPVRGNFVSLHENSIKYYPQSTETTAPIILERGKQSLSLLAAKNIAFDETYFIRVEEQNAELYKKADDGAISSLKFYEAQDIYPESLTGYPSYSYKISSSSLLVGRNTMLRFYKFDKAAEALVQSAEIDLNEKLSEFNQISSIHGTAMFGSYLLVHSDNKLHLFAVKADDLTYLDTAVSGVNNFGYLPSLAENVEMDGALLVRNSNTMKMQELRVIDNKLSSKDLFELPYSHWSSFSFKVVSTQLHVFFDRYLYVYKKIDDKFQLLSLNNLNSYSLYYLDERFILTMPNELNLVLSKIDLASGIPTEVESVQLENPLYPRNAFLLGQHLYTENVDTPFELKRYLINRAPDLTQVPTKMQLNQGIAYSTELTALIQDTDAGNTMTFTLVDAVPGITVTEQGTLNYDGSPLSTNEVVVRATDNTDLYSDITLTFEHNKAPALAQPWVAPVINQNKTFVLDLNEFFSDPEGSVLTYEITSTANLTVSTKGIISGTLTEGQIHQLRVQVKDSKGATSSHTLDLTVNAAPVLTGSGSVTLSTDETASVNLATLFADAEGQNISFTATGLPAGLTLSGSTISGKVANAGKFSTLITATDSAGATSQATLNFEVTQPKGSSGSFGWYAVMALWAISLSRRFKKV
ncbi:hypothetical protein EIK76_13300 [Rheinheimera mesophila]|uniref:Dystroglycan-type cadherin-like domain-containing protein n=1 Tax=Rheinheimera mesophila TaxID=1547515 RepID=A0A3P3QGI0_9GAMM|nr:putative Ig domain-containing protein [Rheinheimera mesophila]KKL02115.1 hypothetical protein SD53_06880 [Rheinheimera mesophila]RRJ19433.1 hypothetical protein EIK76_13300 [Rheinheimera mesophila]